MINNILDKLSKIYNRADIYRAYILNENILPIVVNIPKIKQKDIQNNFTKILNDTKKLYASNLPIVKQEFNFKNIGKQLLPVSVSFDNLEDFLVIVEKKDEYDNFIIAYEKILKSYPALKGVFYKKPFLIFEYFNIWDRLLLVCEYLLSNENPNIYIRELSLKGIDTKFIEKYKKFLDIMVSNVLNQEPLTKIGDYSFEKRYKFKYPLPQIRFRILDGSFYGLEDLSVTTDEFKKLNLNCKKVFIIENKITTLSFGKFKDSIVIFGSGYGVSILKDIKWLDKKELYYWGDIDEDGFAILSQIRGYFKHVKSLFMDEDTIVEFKDLIVKHNLVSKYKDLKNLTNDEYKVYEKLQNNFYGANIRIEQEKIPFEYVKKTILLKCTSYSSRN